MTSAPPAIPLRLWMIASLTGSGAFMAMLDSTVANLAIESIATDLAAPLGKVQWVATGYLIALAVSLPPAGWLGRRFGQRRVWAASVLGFVAASAACALSPDLPSLIAARCFQGLAAGVMVPAGQAVLAAAADRRQLGRLMGVVGFAVAIGPALGPAIGGLLIDGLSWRWLFLINIPPGMIALAFARRVIPARKTRPAGPLDRRGLVLIAAGLPLLLYGAAEVGAGGLDPLPVAGAVAGAALAAGFLRHAFRAAAPLVEVRLLLRPLFGGAVAAACCTGAAMYGGLIVLPIFLQTALHRSATEAGLLLLAMGMGAACALPLAGSLTDRYGTAGPCQAGSLLLLLSTAALLVPVEPGATLVVLLFLRGAGLALAQLPAMTAAYGAVAKAEAGDAATVINMAQRLGGALGAVLSVVAMARGRHAAEDPACGWAFVLLVVFAAGSLAAGRSLARRAGPETPAG